MSIVEKKKSEITTGEKVIIISIPKIVDKVNELEYLKEELKKRIGAEEKNIKLALDLKDVAGKYREMFNQNNQNVKLMIGYKKIVDKLNFKFMCPEVKKEITFYNCCDACYNKLCEGLYQCEKRIEMIKEYFKMAT